MEGVIGIIGLGEVSLPGKCTVVDVSPYFHFFMSKLHGSQLMRFNKTVCPSGLRGWTQVPLARAAWVQIPQLSFVGKAMVTVLDQCAPLPPTSNRSKVPAVSVGCFRFHWDPRCVYIYLIRSALLWSSVPNVFLCAMLSKFASAGNQTRVTSMATMYSATRPLMPDERVTRRADQVDTVFFLRTKV